MIKAIKQYPVPMGNEFGGNVRHFDETLKELLTDLKDTMKANTLDALAAFQIGSPYAVIVVTQEDGTLLELINPSVLTVNGTVEPIEKTAYFPKLTAKTKRYEKIKVIYENIEGQQQFLEATGDLSITLQRKIDYLLGSTFIIRLNTQEKEIFSQKLELGVDVFLPSECPTQFKRDKILAVIKGTMVLGFIGLILSLFFSGETLTLIQRIENYILWGTLALIVIYFFYAQYEGKQYQQCTSCQIGNILGTTVFKLIHLSILSLLVYFL